MRRLVLRLNVADLVVLLMGTLLCASCVSDLRTRPPATNPIRYTAAATKPSTRPAWRSLPDVIEWSYMEPHWAIDRWYDEANKRFKNPVLFVCHGSYELATDPYGNTYSTWFCYPDAPRVKQPVFEVCRTLKNTYPGRDVVMIVCNKLGHVPKLKGVWVAKEKVWVVPDLYVSFPLPCVREITQGDDGVGSIWEFVEWDGK